MITFFDDNDKKKNFKGEKKIWQLRPAILVTMQKDHPVLKIISVSNYIELSNLSYAYLSYYTLNLYKRTRHEPLTGSFPNGLNIIHNSQQTLLMKLLERFWNIIVHKLG